MRRSLPDDSYMTTKQVSAAIGKASTVYVVVRYSEDDERLIPVAKRHARDLIAAVRCDSWIASLDDDDNDLIIG